MGRLGRGTCWDPAPGDVYTVLDGSAWKVASARQGLLELTPYPRPGGRRLTLSTRELLARAATWTHTRDRDMSEILITVAGETYAVDELKIDIHPLEGGRARIRSSVPRSSDGLPLYEYETIVPDLTAEAIGDAVAPTHEWLQEHRA